MNAETLDICSLEPIHIPGKIQGHGFLIIVDTNGIVRFCSENIKELLQISPDEVLNQPLSKLNSALGKDASSDFLSSFIDLALQGEQFNPINPYPITVAGKPWNMIMGKASNHYLLDFEPAQSDLASDIHLTIGSGLSEMLADKALQTILENSAYQIKRIIGYDRVMVYKFHSDGHGEVMAEAKNEDTEPWLGLHYPAEDIPEQARELYKLNWTRLIADVHAPTIALLNLSNELADLTNSTLRAVSPIHIQYLKNMEVSSSFSISIIAEGNLWGLIACHNYSPRFINFRQRETAKLIGQVLSSCVELRQQEADQAIRERLRDSVSAVTRKLFDNKAIPDILKDEADILLQAFSASGMAFFYESELHTFGHTPEKPLLKELYEEISSLEQPEFIATNKIRDAFQHIPVSTVYHAGLLACKLNQRLTDCLLFFRSEKRATIRWAGKPEKTIRHDENGFPFIAPRNSFSLWEEQVAGSSDVWLDAEKEALAQLRNEIDLAVSRRTTELRLMNEKLRSAYAELDSFAYTISHDLKTPLTAIMGYADLIGRNAAAVDSSRMMSQRIRSSAEKMQGMIETLLHYARMGQKSIQNEPVDMHTLLHDICEQLTVSKENENLNLLLLETPAIYGDPVLIFQVFLNVIENAVKYSHKVKNPKVTIKGNVNNNCTIYSITDNGIGISQADQGKIFDLFSRMGDPSMFKGSGVGLSIVKKILNRHGAEIAVSSEEGKGSTFTLIFPHLPEVA